LITCRFLARSTPFTLFLGVILLLPSSAQTYRSFRAELEGVKETTRWQIGPFRLSSGLSFRDIGYDGNVYYQSEDEGPVSDYTATVSPRIQVNVLYRDWLILSVSENPEYVYYIAQERERGFNNTLSSSLRLHVFHRFALSGEYFNQKRRQRASSEFDVRVDQETERFKAQFFYETPRRTSLGMTASVSDIHYENSTVPGTDIWYSRALDRTETTASFEFYYKVFAESFFFVSGGTTDYAFKYRETKWRDSYSYQVYSGIRFPLLGKIQGTFSFGYKKLFPRAGFKKRFSGFVGNTSLSFRLGRVDFRLLYNKDCQFSFWTENAFFVEQLYGGGFSFYLTRFLRLDYDFLYGDNQYPEETLVRLPDESYVELNRRDKTKEHSVGFAFRIIKDVGLGIRIHYLDWDSNDYRWGRRKRLFTGAYLTFDF